MSYLDRLRELESKLDVDFDRRPADCTSEKPEADIPVPDRLLPKWKSKNLWNRLRLSQQIGLLLWLNRNGALSEGGKERLLYLQAKASFEAIEAGLKFAQRLTREKKLQSDFKHQLVEANRRPQSKRFRKFEQSRIGVGYRDKGTLPDDSEAARRSTIKDSWLSIHSIPEEIGNYFRSQLPEAVEGDWLDLTALAEHCSVQDREVSQFLNLL